MLQVIVTSYRRLAYLKKTVESLRQDQIELFIIDGGSDVETLEYIQGVSDEALYLKDNPGADVLKTEGIKRFITNPEYMVSSDDLGYPAGYSELLMDQYRAINKDGLAWTFMACNQDRRDIHIAQTKGWSIVNGVEVCSVQHSQVAGAIIDTAATKFVGYFPRHGIYSGGDMAFSKRMRAIGLKVGYFRRPILIHYGQGKMRDYPEYDAACKADRISGTDAARLDDWRPPKDFDFKRDVV